MSDDLLTSLIVRQLRKCAEDGHQAPSRLLAQAADELDALRRELADAKTTITELVEADRVSPDDVEEPA